MTGSAPEATREMLDSVYRTESRRILATGDFDLAEDALHDAFAAALERWPKEGVPANPRAWLVSTGRFKAIDTLRRRARFDASQASIAEQLEAEHAVSAGTEDAGIEDDRPRLIFTCCHPAIALEARVALTLRGNKVEGLVMYEPPFIVDDSRPRISGDLAQQIDRLVSSSRRNEAVKLFFTKAVGIPPIFVTLMRLLMPGWSKMAGMAHAISYDLAVLAGTQEGKPLPAMRWATANALTLVLVGGKSPAFFHTGAQALTGLLPKAEYRALPGRNHSAVVMAPNDIAVAAVEFLCHNGSQTKVTNL